MGLFECLYVSSLCKGPLSAPDCGMYHQRPCGIWNLSDSAGALNALLTKRKRESRVSDLAHLFVIINRFIPYLIVSLFVCWIAWETRTRFNPLPHLARGCESLTKSPKSARPQVCVCVCVCVCVYSPSKLGTLKYSDILSNIKERKSCILSCSVN